MGEVSGPAALTLSVRSQPPGPFRPRVSLNGRTRGGPHPVDVAGALSPTAGARYKEVEEAIETARDVLSGRVVWHINSTARGGGVAELLQSLLAYARGAGVDARWVVIDGDPEFFSVTKRIHNHLHGSAGRRRGARATSERKTYEAALGRGAERARPSWSRAATSSSSTTRRPPG